MTEHEWLISKGLAKPGRGRRSLAAKAALEQARKDGVVFNSESATKRPEGTTAKPVESDVVVRPQTVMWGIDKAKSPSQSDLVIAFTDCLCGKIVSKCKCKDGPRLPKFIGGGIGLLDKP
jgi:hypothetical protein